MLLKKLDGLWRQHLSKCGYKQFDGDIAPSAIETQIVCLFVGGALHRRHSHNQQLAKLCRGYFEEWYDHLLVSLNVGTQSVHRNTQEHFSAKPILLEEHFV